MRVQIEITILALILFNKISAFIYGYYENKFLILHDKVTRTYMKSLQVPYVDALNNATIENAFQILDDAGHRDTIEVLNWKKEFPYRPITFFNIARSSDALFIKYFVRGSMLKAIYLDDQMPVNEDSCVEFFFKIPGNEKYINFEFNCIGTCKASRRVARNVDVLPYTLEELSQVKRYSSLSRKAFQEMEGMFEWELAVKIPMRIMGIDPNNLPEKILGNFYKCADATDSMHYVTWAPVKTDHPDFHRPEYFGEIKF